MENWSHRNRTSRVIIPVGVAYGSDTAKVRDILLGCIEKDPNILRFPEPQVLFLAFGDSSLDFQVRYFLPDTDFRMKSISDMHYAIDAAFREAGIEIPFPQRDVHLKSDGLSDPNRADYTASESDHGD